MLPFVATLAIAPQYTISRDRFGVPTVAASSSAAAYEGQGFAVAQDRLWQLEMARRLSEGRLAQVLGPSALASDRDVLKLGYAPSEVDAELGRLSKPARLALDAYARGVNDYIRVATANGSLPPEYKENGFQPATWSAHDSAAISIHLLLEFGRGGAGELRDLALLDYLRARPNIGDRAFTIMDDLAWLRDTHTTPTIAAVDDRVLNRPLFPSPSPGGTRAQFDALPKANLFELLPGIQIAERKLSRRAAARLGVPFYTGSYCIVVGSKRSAARRPLLLSGPQMGHTNPAIVHEVALHAPGLRVRGIDIPGVPGVVIGATPRFAWGLTSGVADVEDIYAFKATSEGTYDYDGRRLPLSIVKMSIPVKGQSPVEFEQRRTIYGPVVVKTANGVFALRSAFRGKELSAIETFFRLPGQTTPAGVDRLVSLEPMSFNFFYAFGSGAIGYRYAGRVPLRPRAIDPRLPTPASPANDWRGFIPAAQMPHAMNPASGLFVNWNNQPVAWWPNGDTPVWGQIFRNTEILAALQNGDPGAGPRNRLTAADLARAVRTIAQHDETWRYFKPYLAAAGAAWAKGYDGSLLDGSTTSADYEAFVKALRRTLFLKTTGNFMSETYFDLAVQPTLMLRALEGKTKFDFLAGRKPSDVVAEALKAMPEPAPYQASRFAAPGQAPILYSNRGTYIQLLEWMGLRWSMRTILPPGEAETGPHQADQVGLARQFAFKPPVAP